jgi:hypothetical protein
MPEYAALITVMILERPMCVACVAAKADMDIPSVDAYLQRISARVNVHRLRTERCRACGSVGATVAIGRD